MPSMATTESAARAPRAARNGRDIGTPDLISLPATVDWLRDQGLLLETDVDVNQIIMAIRHTGQESELTVGSGNSVVYGPYFHGGSHIGYNRMNFRWGNVGTFQSAPGSHMWQIITEHYRDAEPIPLTMCFGLPAACTLIAGGGFDYVVLPRGADELGAAGAVQGFPVRLVKARTVDAWAVADCEYVLEG